MRRLIFPAVLLVAGYYAVFGGEYSLLDTLDVDRERLAAMETLEAMNHRADSLRLRADSLEQDDRTLETLARERFGMIRDGEILYRFAGGEATHPEEDR